MTLRIPNEGEGKLLEFALGKSSQETLVLRLFSSNTTPADTDTTATYTEVSGNGYAAKSLTGSSWTVTPGAPSSATYPTQTFTFTGAAGNVYGYFVTSQSSAKVLWAERFSDGPYNVTASGQTINVTPVLTLQDTLD